MTSPSPYHLSTKEEVEPYINLMKNPETLLNGLNGLYQFCEHTKIVINSDQSQVFYYIFQNYNQNQNIIEATLKLIERILQFGEPFNSEEFLKEPFLFIFFTLRNISSSTKSLYYIAKTNSHCAHAILKVLLDNAIVSVDSLLQDNAYNLENNIQFLSAFTLYDGERDKDIITFVSSFLKRIFELSRSNIRPSVRYECLIFLKNALQKNQYLVNLIAYDPYFATTFQTPPNNRDERIQELLLLNIVSHLTRDAMSIIVKNNLLPFIACCMKLNPNKQSSSEEEIADDNSIDYDVACYAIDVMQEISFCGQEATQILYQFGIVQEILSFLSNQCQFNVIISSLMAILQVLKYSTIEQKQLIVQSGFFNRLGEIFSSVPDNLLNKATSNIKDLIDIADKENDQVIINALLGNQTLIDELEYICTTDESESAEIAQQILLRAKKQ